LVIYSSQEKAHLWHDDKAGQQIAKSGNSGKNGANFSTKNPHLHFEISNNISNGGIVNKANVTFKDVAEDRLKILKK